VILPTKYLRQDRALVGVGADVLAVLDRPMSVSALWDRTRAARESRNASSRISFDWFVLALCFLNTVSAIECIDGGLIVRAGANA
jgi:hypothetical protein